jgi:hypothetical protein
MAGGIALIVPDWPAPANVRAVATTRAGGVSAGRFGGLNLGDHVGDDPPAVAENRVRLRDALHLATEPRWMQQVHGTAVACAEQGIATPVADAMIAATPGRACAVLTADCLPVLLCDLQGRHVAAAHAGWRGLAAGILPATVNALREAGAKAGDLLVWFGPAISEPAYEVGNEVRDQFLRQDPGAEVGFSANARGRWQLDLLAVARRQLQSLGLTRIYGGTYCTLGDPDRFFSHRRDGQCGRQATLIWLS